MWIMTQFGILMPAARPKHTIEPGDPNILQLRSRDMQTLRVVREILREARVELHGYDPNIPDAVILSTPDKDYQYRMYIRPDELQVLLIRLVDRIDYEKFKPTVGATPSRYPTYPRGDFLHGLYLRIWGVVEREYRRLQRSEAADRGF